MSTDKNSTGKRRAFKHKDALGNKEGVQVGHPKLTADTPRGKPPVVPIDAGADGRRFAQVVPNVVKKPGQHK